MIKFQAFNLIKTAFQKLILHISGCRMARLPCLECDCWYWLSESTRFVQNCNLKFGHRSLLNDFRVFLHDNIRISFTFMHNPVFGHSNIDIYCQQCGISTSVDSDELVQPPFMLRNAKCCSVSSLTHI